MALDLPDVLEEVLRHVPRSVLVQCTLVCHSWRLATLPFLLRTITLRHPLSLTLLTQTLSDNPTFQALPRTLDITSGPSYHSDAIANDALARVARLTPRVTSLVLRKVSTDCADTLQDIFGSLKELKSLAISVTSDSWHQQLQLTLFDLVRNLPHLEDLALNGVVFARPTPESALDQAPAPSLRQLTMFAVRVDESELVWLVNGSSASLTSFRLVDVDFPRLIAVHYVGASLITVLSTTSSLLSLPSVSSLLQNLNPQTEELGLGLDSRLIDRTVAVSTLTRLPQLRTLGIPLDALCWGLVLLPPVHLSELDIFLLPHLSSSTIRDGLEWLARCPLRAGTRLVVVVGHGAKLIQYERNTLRRICEEKALDLVQTDLWDS